MFLATLRQLLHTQPSFTLNAVRKPTYPSAAALFALGRK